MKQKEGYLVEIESIKKKVLEDVDPELKRKKAREMRKQRIIVSIQFLGLIAVIILLFYMFMGISTVDGDSMYPTLRDKNVVVYKRMNSEFRQGDIVALKQPDGTEYVKRVIAVAGDTVNIQGGEVYVNGEKVEIKDAIGTTERKDGEVTYPLTVGDKEVFVLGDNREVSKDSREFGLLKTDDIKGKIIWFLGRP